MPGEKRKSTATSVAKSNNLLDFVFTTKEEKRKFEEQIQTEAPQVIRGNVPLDRTFRGETLVVISLDRTNYTHGFHKFPAKFIPEIPRWAILKFSQPRDIILDPFAGSGTTNVEARLSSRNSYAIDVHSIAQLLTKVKTTPLDADRLHKERDALLQRIYSSRRTEIPEFPNRDYWFKPKVLKELGIITACVGEVDDLDTRDFFKVCLSSIIKEVSNADPKFLYALAISKKMRANKHLRHVNALDTFKNRVMELTPKMIEFSKKCPRDTFVKVIGKDARAIELPDGSVDLAITSPPYLNAVDYPRAHQLELYWLGLWKGKLGDLKKFYIGTEQVARKDYSEIKKYGNPRLDELLERIYAIDPKRSFVVYKYFTEMRENFLEVKRVLKPNGYYTVAVADNVIRKIKLPTHEILMDIAQEVGYSVEEYYASTLIMRPHDMRQTEKMGGEWVMAFRRGA